MACALLSCNTCNGSKYDINSNWPVVSLSDAINENHYRISEGKKKRSNALKQNRRSVAESDRLPDDSHEEIKPYSRSKAIHVIKRVHSSNGHKEINVPQWKHKTTRISNETPCTVGNLPAFDALDVNDDLVICGKAIAIRSENTPDKKRDFQKTVTTKNLKFSDEANSEVDKDTALSVDNNTCQCIQKQQLLGNHLEDTSYNQIKQISDPFIGGLLLSYDDSFTFSNLFGGTIPLHNFSQLQDIVGSESETLSNTELDVFSLPNDDTVINSRDHISIDSSKQVGGFEEKQTDEITLENTLIDLGIEPEQDDLKGNRKSDENSDQEDSEESSSEEEPTDNNDGFQADLDKLVDESISSKSVIPLIKKELQYKIQYQRLERGDEELKLEPGSPIVYKLTEEEIRKKNNRREQNRRSAVKARARAKEYALKLKQTIQKASSEIENRLAEREKLKEEKSKLLKVLTEHTSVCKKV